MAKVKLLRDSTIVLKAGTVIDLDESTLNLMGGRFERIDSKPTPAAKTKKKD